MPGGGRLGPETFRRSDIYETTDGDGCGRWQRPQPVEVSERGGSCSALWAR